MCKIPSKSLCRASFLNDFCAVSAIEENREQRSGSEQTSSTIFSHPGTVLIIALINRHLFEMKVF
jgi:hypothetical protein